MTPKLSYIICTARRSGSWLLAGGLEDTKIAGHPSEWFNDQEEQVWCERWGIPHPIVNYEQYLDKVIEAGCAGTPIFGVKMLGYNFRDMQAKLWTIPRFKNCPLGEIIPEAFPNPRYIWLTRRDGVRRAISYYRARTSGVWHDMEGRSPPGNGASPVYDPEQIRRCEVELDGFDDFWMDYFSSQKLNPLRIEYEDLAAHYEKTIFDVLEYIGIAEPQKKLSLTPPRFKKQADTTTELWVMMYRAYKLAKGLEADEDKMRAKE